MKITEEVRLILDRLNNNGYSAYVVGGAVRDSLLGKVPYDFDITTSALPEEILKVFDDFKIARIGEAFGTIGVIINEKMYEITTFREECEYENHRKPTKVNFIKDLYFDLSRRDFTINALAYNKEYIDYFNGVEDLKNGIIRTVGDPNLRFEEDGLRVLRCLRFASQLGFVIEEKTKKALFNCCQYALSSSVPRRAIELCKMIDGTYFKNIIKNYQDILKKFLEVFEFNDYLNYLDIGLTKNLLIMYYNHQDILEYDLNDLQIKKEEIKKIKTIYSCIKNIDFNNYLNIRKKIMILIKQEEVEEILNSAVYLLWNYNEINDRKYEVYLNNIKKALSGPYLIKHLKINGNDLVEIGIHNENISGILREILYMVMENTIKNEKEDIIEYIKSNFM